jgi:hypothetical protein
MRTLRLSLAGTVILTLLGGTGSAALAQEGEDQVVDRGPFSASMVDIIDVGDMVWLPGPPFGVLSDWSMALDMEATDPRFVGTWTMVMNGHGFGEPDDPDSFSVYSGTARLENADGVWVGEVENSHSRPYERMRLVVEGQDAYDGLTAIIDQAETEEFGEFQGVVFDGGLPPMPAPVEPSAMDAGSAE